MDCEAGGEKIGALGSLHYLFSEFVGQSCVLIYYNLWNIRKATSHYFRIVPRIREHLKRQNGS